MVEDGKEEINKGNSLWLWFVLLVDGAHCVEHHGEPTDCLQEVRLWSEPIKTQIDFRFPPMENAYTPR